VRLCSGLTSCSPIVKDATPKQINVNVPAPPRSCPEGEGAFCCRYTPTPPSIDPDFWRSQCLRRTSAARFGSCCGMAEAMPFHESLQSFAPLDRRGRLSLREPPPTPDSPGSDAGSAAMEPLGHADRVTTCFVLDGDGSFAQSVTNPTHSQRTRMNGAPPVGRCMRDQDLTKSVPPPSQQHYNAFC
jgi:hypothetical protein